MTQILNYREEHFAGVDQLWRTVFPSDPPRNRAEQAIALKLAQNDELLWVAEDDTGAVVGTIMAGWDGHRGWLYSVAVDPRRQRSGVGRLLVSHAIEELDRRGCNKVNLQIRAGNEAVAAFYKELGFAVEDRVSMGLEI